MEAYDLNRLQPISETIRMVDEYKDRVIIGQAGLALVKYAMDHASVLHDVTAEELWDLFPPELRDNYSQYFEDPFVRFQGLFITIDHRLRKRELNDFLNYVRGNYEAAEGMKKMPKKLREELEGLYADGKAIGEIDDILYSVQNMEMFVICSDTVKSLNMILGTVFNEGVREARAVSTIDRWAAGLI